MVDISECLKAQNVDDDIIEEWNHPLSEHSFWQRRQLIIKYSR